MRPMSIRMEPEMASGVGGNPERQHRSDDGDGGADEEQRSRTLSDPSSRPGTLTPELVLHPGDDLVLPRRQRQVIPVDGHEPAF
jgi:hypothetical protein